MSDHEKMLQNLESIITEQVVSFCESVVSGCEDLLELLKAVY